MLEATPRDGSTPLARPRVLLVDDHEEARWAIGKYLTHSGFDVTEVGRGGDALEALSAGAPFRFLLLDLSLPDIDGREVARLARETSPTTWIAFVTGWSADPDDPSFGEADGVFVKPVDLAGLCRLLRETPEPRAR